MLRLIAVAVAGLAMMASAQALTPAPVGQPDGIITQARFGCGPGRTLVAGQCVARTTIRHTRRAIRRGYYRKSLASDYLSEARRIPPCLTCGQQQRLAGGRGQTRGEGGAQFPGAGRPAGGQLPVQLGQLPVPIGVPAGRVLRTGRMQCQVIRKIVVGMLRAVRSWLTRLTHLSRRAYCETLPSSG